MTEQLTEQNEARAFEVNSLVSFDTLFWDRNHSLSFSPDSVKMWIRNPMTYNKELRMLSRIIYSSNGIYSNVIDYISSLPTLDRVVYGRNKNHTRFKKNKKKFQDCLTQIKDKIFSRDALLKGAIDGVYFGYFESTESQPIQRSFSDTDIGNISDISESKFNCAIIQLPTDYCRIVGKKNSTYTLAFDLRYFDQFRSNGMALKLRRYPKEIRDAYTAFRTDRSRPWYTLDYQKTIVGKFRANIEEPWGRPYGLAAFNDIQFDELFVETKRNTLKDLNSAIMYQTFPEGEKKGTSSLTQKQQKEQHENVRNAFFSRRNIQGINFISLAAGTKLDKIDVDTAILNVRSEDELIKRISTDLGFAGSALNGQDGNFSSQQTNLQMVSAEIFNWLEQLTEELIKVINENIIKDDQCPIRMYYLPITYINRKEMVSFTKELYTQGKGSLQAWIAATGFDPEAYIALMDEEIEEGFDDKYVPHLTSFTMSGTDNASSGRPEMDNPTNENTIKSKTNNGNASPNIK